MKFRTPMFAFNGGELSRRMEGRADLDGIYDRAVAKMLNFVATVEGPAMKRPGFRLIREEDESASWSTSFVFNITQAYLFVWLDGRVRFYTNGGRIEIAPDTPYELAVPYTAAEARELSIKQSYDRLYVAHPNHAPAMITRTGAETFTYTAIPLVNGPFQDRNTNKAQTIVWSGDPELNGSGATITCTAAIFTADMVGSPFMFEVMSFSNVLAWESQVKTDSNIAVGDLRRSDGKVYQCEEILGRYTGTIEPTHTSGSEWDGSNQVLPHTDDDSGAVKWRYLYDRFGMGVITSVTDAYNATISVSRRLPDLSTETYKWALGAFSIAAGWPQLVDVWAQRLIFWKGVDIAGSVTGSYFDFAPIDDSGIYAPDQGFRRRLDTADPPMWTHADKAYLLAGTASGELVVGQINNAAGLSGDNIRADRQSSYGSADAQPAAIGTSVLFVQRGGRKIREAAFDYSQDRFVGANINIYARHVTRSGVEWLAFQQEPEEMLWCGRGDGTLIAHPHSPEQQVKGFARVELAAGTVISGTSIPSEDGSRDELWVLAELDGKRYVLQLAEWWDEDAGLEMADAFFVDYGVSYVGDPISTFTTGLAHLAGKQVRILADGVVIDDKTVSLGGELELDKPASKVTIGLGYQAQLKLLQPEARGTPTAQGLRKRMVRMVARLIDTASLLIGNKHGDKDRFFDRQNNSAMNAPPPLFTGSTDNKSVGDGSSFEVTAEIISDDPLPCLITQLLPTYELEEIRA